ncbi:MAG: diacylglycerol kinase family protein [Candidatus Omnitrophota bacterium]|nr:MAG: diacylglycerol kinase family protein [Candidatus Omnitrophota bacterium]
MKSRTLLNSFKFAWQGFMWAFKNQRNLRIHTFIGIGVILAGLILKLTPLKIAVLLLTIMFVIVCEIINTALELSFDFANGTKFNPSIKVVKDIVAAGVLFASLNAIVVGIIIFYPYVFK